tara:strand:- start:1071 stop:1451 length:381 start_codon:yes stop_codon:yes gene_type:complete
MKFLLGTLIVTLSFFIMGCYNKREYFYPTSNRLELQRICRYVIAGNTNRFMVILGKIYPLNNDGISIPLEEISTTIEDAGYFCGPYRLKNSPCSKGKKKRLDHSACMFRSYNTDIKHLISNKNNFF